MAPTRKPSNVNKRISNLNGSSPGKDGVYSNKNKQRKKKLSDKLGSQWRKEELERFYEAYRMYGKDWKKVAAVVRNRSTEMVEALFNMNQAYLSLPEGTASVVGLIAMMTDHYNLLEGSESERESNDLSESLKPVKQKCQKVQLGIQKESVQSLSISSNDDCLSLLKRRCLDGNQPRAVGKRTPRIPVSYYKKDDRGNYVSPRRTLKSGVNSNDDEVAHVAALVLAEAAQCGGLTLVCQTPCRRAEKSSPVQSWERMQSETPCAKFCNASEECLEAGVESRGAENGEYARDNSSLMGIEGVVAVEIQQKEKKIYRKRERAENVGNHLFGDGGEPCSGTKQGVDISSLKEKVDNKVVNTKPEQFSPEHQRKRSRELYFGDESSRSDALQTLADLFLMMPASPMESELSIQLKEETIGIDEDDKFSLAKASLMSQSRDGIKLPDAKQKLVHAANGVEGSTSRKSVLGRELTNDTNTLLELKEQLPSSIRTWKRNRKPIDSKSVVDEESKPGIKRRHKGQHLSLPKQLKSVRSSDSSICSDQKDLTVSAAEVPLTKEVSLPMKQSRRKMRLPRIFMPKGSCSEKINQPYKYSAPVQDRAFYLKEKLSGCLSSYLVRRWCAFEWFYSAIDYPWFAKREFMEYLNHVGLGNIPRLTRVEWSVIKSSLGKPRRFSDHFLNEERQKLEQYRETVRNHYTELQTSIQDGLPTDLARPLVVGQRTISLHPKSREVHDGSVLTVDHDKCRIQFDHPELGVEFVRDIDCMPMNPLDNMPEALRRQFGSGNVSGRSKESYMNGNSNTCVSSGPLGKAPNLLSTYLKQGKDDVDRAISQSEVTADNVCAQQAAYSQPCSTTHHQTKEADIQALYELTCALDKKERLLMELRNANDATLENQNDIDCLRYSESLRKHYATVLVELKEASGQVSSALLRLRQRNTYTSNSLPPWMMAQASFNIHEGLPSALCNSPSQELESTVIEIIKGSTLRAHAMVISAVQAFSSRREGEDAFMKIGQVLDSIDNQQLESNSGLPVIRPHELLNSSSGHDNGSVQCASDALPSDAPSPKLHNEFNKVDNQIPSELITSCVATLIMIQTCSERQYPPADVAQILDSAVTNLHPCCSQNLPLFREIQMCMGRIKTQILALIPT